MERVISEINGDSEGPLMIYLAGIHGNESHGITALQNVFNSLQERNENYHGRAIALRGNLSAIAQNTRYIDFDLNRIWDKHHFETVDKLNVSEYKDLKEIKEIINAEIAAWNGKVYLIDLHTTSAPTIPFMVTQYENNDHAFIQKMKVPFITGLSGFLDGTILAWICKQGHCGLAFEAGQHMSKHSIIKHEAFVYLSMFHSGFYTDQHKSELKWLRSVLDDELKPQHQHFELVERYHIDVDEEFKMAEGFTNFQKIYKGEVLASNRHGDIISHTDGNIFMPLYQEQGDDGYFIIKPVI